jgi:AcrR family transcriptional regulator
VSPTVEQAATAASVSRTTAYRYFPNQTALLAAAHPETATRSMLGDDPSPKPAERLDEVVRAFTAMIVDTEPQQRTMLRLSWGAHAALPLRQGRAIAWIGRGAGTAPGPAHRPRPARARLLAIRSAVGIEALVWLTDIAGLPRPEAVELRRWSAQGLLTAEPPLPVDGPARH